MKNHLAGIVALVAAAHLIGCAAIPGLGIVPTGNQQVIAQATAKFSNPRFADWSTQHVSSPAITEARRQLGAAARAHVSLKSTVIASDRSLQAIFPVSSSVPNGKKIAGAPAYNYNTGDAFWLTEDGFVQHYSTAGGWDPLYQIDNITSGDTFINTDITISGDGAVLYACSSQGRLYAFPATSTKGTALTNSPVAISGASSVVGGCGRRKLQEKLHEVA